ncbi:MAG TPA: addiction module protein [Clostridiales bacterium]|jgi:Fic family protein|nr:addiction module protein [Clostridiales bacterium]
MFDKEKPYNDFPLISSIQIEETNSMQKLAEDTRVAVELLNYAVSTLPSPNVLLDTLALQEAKVSSNVENIVTTNDDLYMGAVFNSYTAEAKEVSNYKEALFIGFNNLKKKGILSLSDIEEINKPVNKKAPNIRTNLSNFQSDLTIIANKKTNGEIETIYTPPHGKDLLQRLLIDMLDYVYDDETYMVHPLIKIALAHYQFESIHPFRDGNGRTGRILNILFLCQKNYLSFPILYASSYIIENKNEYYSLLNECTISQSYTEIVEYMLNSFKLTAERTLQIVEKIRVMLHEYKSDEFLNDLKGQKQVMADVVELIFEKVYVRIADLVEIGVHRQTASTYLNQFVEKGLLTMDKVGRDNIYKNIKLLELFEGENTNEQ